MPRKAKPWYRKGRGWYVTFRGKQVKLPVKNPKAEQEARRAFERLKNDGVSEDHAALAKLIRQLVRDAVREELAAVVRLLHPEGVEVKPGGVADLMEAFLQSQGGRVGEKAMTTHRRYLGWLAAHYPFQPVTALRCDEVQRRAEKEGWADNTVRLCLSSVAKFMKWCGISKARFNLPPSKNRGAEVVVSSKEYRALLKEAQGDFRAVLQFLWLTGCRPGEARVITAEMVDWKNQTITLKEHKTERKGKVRIIYLCPESLAVLKGQLKMYKTGPLFRDRGGGQFTHTAYAFRFRRARDRAKVRPAITLYSLRHTFATRALESGLTDHDVAALLGHTSTHTLHKTYSHITSNAKRLKKLAAKVGGKA